MSWLALHIKSISTDRNKPGIWLTYYDSDDWGTITRSLTHKGVHHRFLATRSCTDEEMRIESNPWRVQFLIYTDWEALFRDEKKYTQDPKWFNELKKLRAFWKTFETRGYDQRLKC